MQAIISKCLLTVGIAVYAILIPYLEINASHVFNPAWPPHARFHEVWQLSTHILLGIVALYLVWFQHKLGLAAIISCCIMGGVIVANGASNLYGGSVLSGNLTRQILGLDLAVFIAIVVCVLSILAYGLDRHSKKVD